MRPEIVRRSERNGYSQLMRQDAGEIEEHLRGASDAILLLLTELGQLEQYKRHIPPGEDRFDEVARSVRAVAQSLAEFTEHQEAWAGIATADRHDLATIEQSANAKSLAAILERWRAVERQLDNLQPGTPEAISMFAEFERIRAEYMTAFRMISEDSAAAED
jgi:predicted  nucleic acid-binding Zn-ribbon protein